MVKRTPSSVISRNDAQYGMLATVLRATHGVYSVMPNMNAFRRMNVADANRRTVLLWNLAETNGIAAIRNPISDVWVIECTLTVSPGTGTQTWCPSSNTRAQTRSRRSGRRRPGRTASPTCPRRGRTARSGILRRERGTFSHRSGYAIRDEINVSAQCTIMGPFEPL